jgi:hypothetical protein
VRWSQVVLHTARGSRVHSRPQPVGFPLRQFFDSAPHYLQCLVYVYGLNWLIQFTLKHNQGAYSLMREEQ